MDDIDGHDARWTIAPATAADREPWARLYRSYGVAAGQDVGDDHLARVWAWLLDPAARPTCLLLRPAPGGDPVGLAHYRTFERPLAGSIGCYLDDLFVAEAARGRGGARLLLQTLADLAGTHGWSTVRWTTKVDNPAQGLYDALARRSPVITYDLEPSPTGRT